MSHWKYKGSEKIDPDKYFGFVYRITNLKKKKEYIGCKQYTVKRNKKNVVSNWKTYMGSSKALLKDIKKTGKKNFLFEIIDQYENKRSMKYYECYYQMLEQVLTKTVDGTDEHAYYNNYVGGRFTRPVKGEYIMTEADEEKIALRKQNKQLRIQLERANRRIKTQEETKETGNSKTDIKYVSYRDSWGDEVPESNVIDFQKFHKKIKTTKEDYTELQNFMIECGYDPEDLEDVSRFWSDIEEGQLK